jgi:glycosyltransferase involved in cell wall biosynthesis
MHVPPELPPLVSVIIPVYNGELFLAAAIDSVLAQTYPSIELVVVDDGSTDRSGAIAQSYPVVKYVYKTNGGIASARNRGIQAARSEFLAFQDADDIWMPNKLSLQMAAFQADPDLQIVSGLVEQFVTPGHQQRYSFPAAPLPGYWAGAMVVRRSVFDANGWFPEDSITTDISWIAGLIDRNQRILILPHVFVRRRIHGSNVGIVRRTETTQSMIRDLKHSIERKRSKERNSGPA